GSGRIDHQIDSFSRLGEWDDFTQAVGSGEDHHDAVETQRDSTVWRRPKFQRLEEESKSGTRFFIGHPKSIEDLLLNVLTVNSDRTRSQFGSVQNDVIGECPDRSRIGEQLAEIFLMR